MNKDIQLEFQDMPSLGGNVIGGTTGGDTGDREGEMAKADLFKLAKYSYKLFKKIQDEDQFESWVQAKITKAADYIASVYHYLEYEMKFSEYGEQLENSDVYSESEKRELRNRLVEARGALRTLKLAQAEKIDLREGTSMLSESAANFDASDLKGLENIGDLNELKKQAFALITKPSKRPMKPEKVQYAKNQLANMKAPAQVIAYMWQQLLGGEGMRVIGSRHSTAPSNYSKRFDEGLTDPCTTCGGTGHVEKQIPERAKKLVDKHKKLHSFIDKKFQDLNGNGIDDRLEGNKEVDENWDEDDDVIRADRELKKLGKKPIPAAKINTDKDKIKRTKKDSSEEDDVDESWDEDDDVSRADRELKKLGKKPIPAAKINTDKDKIKRTKKDSEEELDESVTPVKKPSAIADKKGGNPFAKKDDAKKGNGDAFKAVLDKEKMKEATSKRIASALWNQIKESAKDKDEKEADKDYDGDGEVESGKEEHKGSVDKAIKASKEKECMNESADLARLMSITSRVLR